MAKCLTSMVGIFAGSDFLAQKHLKTFLQWSNFWLFWTPIVTGTIQSFNLNKQKLYFRPLNVYFLDNWQSFLDRRHSTKFRVTWKVFGNKERKELSGKKERNEEVEIVKIPLSEALWSKVKYVIAADTIVSGLQENLLSKNGLNVEAKSLPGCAVDDMFSNTFVPSARFLYPLKASENLKSFLMFSRGRERVHWEQMG